MIEKNRRICFSIFDVYEYMIRGMTLKEIAKEKNCSISLVQKRLKEMGIEKKWRRASKYPLPKDSLYVISEIKKYKSEIEKKCIFLDFKEK